MLQYGVSCWKAPEKRRADRAELIKIRDAIIGSAAACISKFSQKASGRASPSAEENSRGELFIRAKVQEPLGS